MLLTHLGIYVDANVCTLERTHDNSSTVFRALCMVCPGTAISWNRQDCKRQSMERVQNT